MPLPHHARVLSVYDAIGRHGSRPPPGLALPTGERLARQLGYPSSELAEVPPEIREAFVGAAPLAPEVDSPGAVADLGCGAGLDSWILARRGHPVVAIDASAPMLARLAAGGRRLSSPGPHPVRARLPHVPLADASVRWILLNGVANIVPDRRALLRETARVLVGGGQLRAADLVAVGTVPAELRAEPEAWAWCVAGATTQDRWLDELADAGFDGGSVELVESFPPLARAVIRARKTPTR